EFERSSKHLRKKYNYKNSPELTDEIMELFERYMDQPEDLSRDVFDFVLDGRELGDDEIIKLSDMVDLFRMDYNSDFNRLGLEDWRYLKDLVNNWALDMDMDIVTYVMQRVVDAGAFD
ncbi:MAG: hypothetical protein PQJ50_05465, partial [Spirochaetales bacterium]|nr:hypothetical protein [Spirochaetales bacterium]